MALVIGGGALFGKGIEYEVQLFTVGPDLPLVYRVNAFAQHLKGIVPRQHALAPARKASTTKSVHTATDSG